MVGQKGTWGHAQRLEGSERARRGKTGQVHGGVTAGQGLAPALHREKSVQH